MITPDLLGNGDASVPVDSTGPQPTVQDLLLAFDFNGDGVTVTDSSPRGMNGTLSDAASRTDDGRNARGVALSGAIPATQFVSLPSGLLAETEDFTIAVWVKLNSVQAWARIYDIGNGLPDPANRFMYLTVSGFSGPTPDGIHAASYGGSAANENILASNSVLPIGVWKHVALSGSGGKRTLFIDGFPAAQATGGPDVPPKEMEPIAPNSWLGRSRFPADPGLDGTLDDFRVYGRELAVSEIQDLAWPQLDFSHFRFDETEGTTAADSSDRGATGTVFGAATWTTGRLGGALDLPGAPAGADGPHAELAANPLATCATGFTISTWINLRQLTPWARVFDFGVEGNSTFIYLAPTDGTGMHFAMVSPAGLFDMVTTTPPVAADGSWHHVAVTVDNDGVAVLYVDGSQVKTQTSPDVRPSQFANLTQRWLGKSRFPDPYLNGSIDELRISCRVYSTDEIRNLSHP